MITNEFPLHVPQNFSKNIKSIVLLRLHCLIEVVFHNSNI